MPRWWICLAALVLAPAAAPADPLRHVPKEAGLVVVVERPRQLAEVVRDFGAYQSARVLPAVREALDSTAARRFFQLVAYYERDLGAAWPELIDKLAGKGVAIGSLKLEDNGPALFVAEGTDADATARFFKLAVRALEEETARQSASGADAQKVRRARHGDTDTVHLGDGFHMAHRGAVLIVANKEHALHAGLDVKPEASVAGRPEPKAARKLLGGDPLAWVWFDFAATKQAKEVKDFFEATRKDGFQTIVAGGTIDAFRRADYITAGLWATADGVRLAVRLPSKRADFPADLGLHVPPAGTPGSLPLLEPKGVVYSQSFHLDLAALWKDRKKVLNDQQLKDVEQFEKDVSKVLPNTTLGKLLATSGAHHRIVAVHSDEVPYPSAPAPEQPIPPVALVTTMRDPQFGKSMSASLRAAALLVSFQAGLKMSEETHDGVAIVSYRFPENKSLPDDPGNLRYNAVPCFAVVGDYLVVSSRPSLIKTLIPELRKPADPAKASRAVWRAKAYAAGAADVLRSFPDPTITATILSEGVGLDEAKKQVEALAKWLGTLGSASLELDHGPDAFQIQVEWKTK